MLSKSQRFYQHYKYCAFRNLINNKNNKEIIDTTIIHNYENSMIIESRENNNIMDNNKRYLFFKDIFIKAADKLEQLYELIDNKYKLGYLKQIKNYNVISKDVLGKGTFGLCCFALDKKTKKPLAIKIPSESKYIFSIFCNVKLSWNLVIIL